MNEKLLSQAAKIPIIPDDLSSLNVFQDHELIMDFQSNDIYVKNGDEYINITGQIKEKIQEIAKSSSMIRIVTEETLPIIEDRVPNVWYFVIKRSTERRDITL